MTEYAIDYSWGRPDPHKVKAAGINVVCRYLGHDKTGKCLTKGEALDLLSAGLAIVPNFEDSPTRPLKGYDAGVADGALANAQAEAIGVPRDIPIYYSVDTDPGQPPHDAILQYFHGLNKAGPRPVDCYGGAGLIRNLRNNGLIRPARSGWISNASSWSHGIKDPDATMQQLTSHPPVIDGFPPNQFDANIVLAPPGAWGGAPILEPHGDDLMYLIRDNVSGAEYATDFIVKRHLKSADEVAVVQLALATHGLPTAALQVSPTQAATIPDYAPAVSGSSAPVDTAAIAKAVADAIHARLAE